MERISELGKLLGKSPGYILLGAFIATGIFALSAYEKDVSALTGPISALCVGVFGGGAAKQMLKGMNGGRK